MSSIVHMGRRFSDSWPTREDPDWQRASPKRIAKALAAVQRRPTGGWYALDARTSFVPGARPRKFEVHGHELVAFTGPDGPVVAPASCPHMGADLCTGHVRNGHIVCPWHGLALGPKGHGAWRPLRVHDDGVLLWVQLEDKAMPAVEAPLPVPVLPPRPAWFIPAVHRIDLRCNPEDVIANRLDPWHGAHLHPHSFAGLEVQEESGEVLRLRVSVKVLGPLCSEAEVTFHSPTARSIVMTIVRGEGAGSVLETHTTPIGPGRTAIIEATLATSDRRLFKLIARVPVLRHLMRQRLAARSARLWVEDAEYAERTYALRERARVALPITTSSPDRGESPV